MTFGGVDLARRGGQIEHAQQRERNVNASRPRSSTLSPWPFVAYAFQRWRMFSAPSALPT
ncbi:hypothetical protein, partial [Microbacterium istanbulense]